MSAAAHADERGGMKEGPKAIRCILAHFKGKNLRRCDREQQLMTSRPPPTPPTTILWAQKGRINKDAAEGGSFNEEGRGGARGFTGVALRARIRVAGEIRAAGSVPMFGIGGKDK